MDSEGRRQEKYESPADVLPRKSILIFSEGRRQEKIHLITDVLPRKMS